MNMNIEYKNVCMHKYIFYICFIVFKKKAVGFFEARQALGNIFIMHYCNIKG